ncbi:MAG TPA: FHA domain-containing protein [Crinalium sp.]|jgi:ferredoxin-NADP reductase
MLKIKLLNYPTGDLQETVLTPETMLNHECIIGRTSSCNLILDSLDVSRVHGRIQFLKGEYYYTDLGSANGSFINNQAVKVNQSYSLKMDDLIRIGDFILFVEAIETTSSKGETSIWQKLNGDRQYWTKGDLTVRCVRITNETSDVKTFVFVAEPLVLFDYKPGQFVTLEFDINGEEVLRSYSISSTPSRPHTLEITVKRVAAPANAADVPAGLVSNWLHDNLHVGSQVKLKGPLGKFTCLPTPAQKLLFISAGSGITPMMSMSRWLADTAAESDVVFFHCARTARDIIFRQELEMMATRLPNFRLAISTTRPDVGHPWFGFTGRLTETMLRAIAPDFQERTVYVCGPNEFMQSTKDMLEHLNFPMQNYYEESFGAPKKAKRDREVRGDGEGREVALVGAGAMEAALMLATSPSPLSPISPPSSPSPSSPSSPPLIVFAQSGKEVDWDEEAESILELAEQEGIKIRSNCRQGVCGACKKRKLEGEIRYESSPDALDDDEQAAGYVLTCVASPVGRVVIDA